jgi:hypothetical protein
MYSMKIRPESAGTGIGLARLHRISQGKRGFCGIFFPYNESATGMKVNLGRPFDARKKGSIQ